MSNEILYDLNSIAITTTLLVLIIVANEAGYRTGLFVQGRSTSDSKTLTGSVQASVLGMLALLLGFTFSMSMQRYDARHQALISETNAISTIILRVDLLPEQFRAPANELVQRYLDLRIQASDVDLTAHAERQAFYQKTKRLQSELWNLAVAAVEEDPRGITTGAFMSSLIGVIDAQDKRNALLQLHVPEVVLMLLFLVFISAGGFIGYSAGLAGNRITVPTILVSLLISLIVFIIIDLDRPRRGVIQVDASPLHDLKLVSIGDLAAVPPARTRTGKSRNRFDRVAPTDFS